MYQYVYTLSSLGHMHRGSGIAADHNASVFVLNFVANCRMNGGVRHTEGVNFCVLTVIHQRGFECLGFERNGFCAKSTAWNNGLAMVRYPIATIKAISLHETVDHRFDTLGAMHRNGLCI